MAMWLFRFADRVYSVIKKVPLLRGLAQWLYFVYCKFRYPPDAMTVYFEPFAGSYTCNPKAIYEHMLQDEKYAGYKFIWGFAPSAAGSYSFLKNGNTRIALKGTRQYFQALAESRYWVTSTGIPLFCYPGKERILLQTWHGKPIKKIGFDKEEGSDYKSKKSIHKGFRKMAHKMTWLLSPDPTFTPIFSSVWRLGRYRMEDKIIENGYPRNARLFTFTETDALRTKMSMGIPLGKKVVLYAPTWHQTSFNQKSKKFATDIPLDLFELRDYLGDDYVFLFRSHNLTEGGLDLPQGFFDVGDVEDINDLYIISDMMVSDYSSAIFDYANLRRPIVLFPYDYEDYCQNTGVYMDVLDFPFPAVYDQEQLQRAIVQACTGFQYDEPYQKFNEMYNSLEGPHAVTQLLDRVVDANLHQVPRRQKHIDYAYKMRNFNVRTSGFFRSHGFLLSQNSHKLRALKNRYRGQRCFLIGNGPSLSSRDLEMLAGETCFGCNLIYKTFDVTSWRPAFYFMQDAVYVRSKEAEIWEALGDAMVVANSGCYGAIRDKQKENLVFVNSAFSEGYHVVGNLLNYYETNNGTVMVLMIEAAMYMGFSEIYLLGVDCSNALAGDSSHFISGYMDDSDNEKMARRAKTRVTGNAMSQEELGLYYRDRSIYAYHKLRQYADAHGFHIYNATRGGYLEEFERANLDDVVAAKPQKKEAE